MPTKELTSAFDVTFEIGSRTATIVIVAGDEAGARADARSFLKHYQPVPEIVSITKRAA